MPNVISDTLGTLAYTLGLSPQIDVLLDEKFGRVRDHYRSPILDFGAGTGHFAWCLTRSGYQVTAVDVVDRCQYPEVDHRIFTPPSLDFDDGFFETSVAHFVFHHIEDQDSAFSELRRVTRTTIIVSEDIVESRWDGVLASLHTGTSPWAQSWHGFRSIEGWLEFFEKHSVSVETFLKIPRWRTPFYPILRAVFVLKIGTRQEGMVPPEPSSWTG
jgi:SAM-dependent methyltransferase